MYMYDVLLLHNANLHIITSWHATYLNIQQLQNKTTSCI